MAMLHNTPARGGWIALAAALLLMLGWAPAASAESVLRLDFHNLTVQALDEHANHVFGGVNHTGELVFGRNSTPGQETRLVAAMAGDDPVLSGAALSGYEMYDVAGSFLLDAGEIAGGQLSLSIREIGQATGDTLTFKATAGSGSLVNLGGWFGFGDDFAMQLESDSNLFGSSAFGPVDVTAWSGRTLLGEVMMTGYNPDGVGFDTRADLRTTAVTPLPAPALAGGAMLVALGAWRNRRRARQA